MGQLLLSHPRDYTHVELINSREIEATEKNRN